MKIESIKFDGRNQIDLNLLTNIMVWSQLNNTVVSFNNCIFSRIEGEVWEWLNNKSLVIAEMNK